MQHYLWVIMHPEYEKTLREANEARAFAIRRSMRPARVLVRAAANALGRLWARFRAYRERERALDALSEMSDRQLEDIGIHRGLIETAVRHGRSEVNRKRGINAEIRQLGHAADSDLRVARGDDASRAA